MTEVTAEMAAAWVKYEPIGQFHETMSFARFIGMLKHAFYGGWLARKPVTPTRAAILLSLDTPNSYKIVLLKPDQNEHIASRRFLIPHLGETHKMMWFADVEVQQ